MTLVSAPGEGATFTVVLPLKPSSDSAEGAGFDVPDLTGKTVLIVAAKSIEASLVEKRLERWGAKTCVAPSLAIAQALLPERAWHAVLIDHDFPADARDALAQDARRHAERRILLVTPFDRAGLRGTMPAAFSGYLMKPLRAASLAARMRDDVSFDLGESAAVASESDGLPEPAPKRTAHGLSVLIAEDNEINALLIRALLTRLGHDPVVVTDGAAARDAWLLAERAGTSYELVLMDLQMPGLDGVTATRQIRAHEAEQGGRRTPIYALTANALSEDRAACTDAGMDGFLVKPLDRDRLEAVLAELSPQASVAA